MLIVAAFLIFFFSSTVDALVTEGVEAVDPVSRTWGEVVEVEEMVVPAPVGTAPFDGYFDWRMGY